MNPRQKLEAFYGDLRPYKPTATLPFVRARQNGDEANLPLLLAFPLDILRHLTQYLSASDLNDLILTGSPILAQILQAKGGVDTLRVYRINRGGFFDCKRVSFISTFRGLLNLEFRLPARMRVGYLDWKIADLPPTLTRLHLEYEYPLSSFMVPNSVEMFDIMARTVAHPDPMQIVGSHFSLSHPDFWLDTAVILPKLKYLAIIGGQNMRNTEHKKPHSLVAKLPSSLETLLLPGLDAADGFWHSAPANLTRLAFNPSPSVLKDTPAHITRLELSGRMVAEDFAGLTNLLEIKSFMQIPAPDPAADLEFDFFLKHLPRGLQSLETPLEIYAVIHVTQYPSIGSAIAHLPPSLTKLDQVSFPSRYLKHLPQTLTHLSFSANIDETQHILFLPRGLRLLKVLGFTENLTDESVRQLPPNLTSLSAITSQFDELWLADMVPRIKWLSFRAWRVSGLLLPADATGAVDVPMLHRALRRMDFIDASVLKTIDLAPLRYIPPNVNDISGMPLHSSIRYADLPREIISLPKSYQLRDDAKQDLRDLPQKLKSLSIQGNIRLRSWLSLPIRSIPGYSRFTHRVVLEKEDINWALDYNQETQTPPPTFDVPLSLMAAYRASEEKLTGKTCYSHVFGQRDNLHALWEPEHYARIPDSVTSLRVSIPHKDAEKPWMSLESESEGQAASDESSEAYIQSVVKLPPSLTSLIIDTKTSELQWRNSKNIPIKTLPKSLLSPESASAFARCNLCLSVLPTTLTYLKITGRVDMEDLEDIGRLTSLRSLSLGILTSRTDRLFYATESSFIAFVSRLPPSLTLLHVAHCPDPTNAIRELPRSLLELRIKSRPRLYSLHEFSNLPPSLTRLNVNTMNLPAGYEERLPPSLTDITLRQRLPVERR